MPRQMPGSRERRRDHGGDDDELDIRVRAVGPTPDQHTRLGARILSSPALAKALGRARHRLVSLEYLPADDGKTRSQPSAEWSRFRAAICDYTNSRTLIATGSAARPAGLQVVESAEPPLPSPDEFDAAVRILRANENFGPRLRSADLIPYPPMPPLQTETQANGRVLRLVTVGLRPSNKRGRHEIVAVNLASRTVTVFNDRAPGGSMAGSQTCGQPYAGQPTTSKGTPGQAWVTVSRGGHTLWRFLVVRPAASSGTRGSGVELRYVDYRGKRVLYRAHVPILNVKYDADACGPYRDWQYQEGMLTATGLNVVPGFMLCSSPAQTILDNGSDVGNFLGVAIYVDGTEVVLVSEMQAGWYRYVSMWRLDANGTIRPRFGFAAVDTSSCVCNRHHHHVYWRFDFDIVTAGNNRVREFNNPCLPFFCPSKWHTKLYEISRPRDPGRHRRWRVENVGSRNAYEIVPGPNDGRAASSPDSPFPRGDVWVLRYHGNELDDGVNHTGPPCEAEIGGFVNGEAVDRQDVVMWYAAHVTHDVAAEPPGTFGHIAGPELRAVRW